MNYLQLSLNCPDQQRKDILIALLTEVGFEGFEEQHDELLAFISAEQFDREQVGQILVPFDVSYSITEIEKRNWNQEWENNFQPVVVDGFCTVRADFHQIKVATPYEVVITPKMSFGTGHHATTQLMISNMRDLDFVGKSVLDFGTGTGILAILAIKLGSENVIAIDNDEWSYENAQENAVRNNTNIEFRLGSLESLEDQTFDIVLANINRHVLLDTLQQLSAMTVKSGRIILSGLLTEDRDIIMNAATAAGLALQDDAELNNWIALSFVK